MISRNKFFKKYCILVIGASGFLGRKLVIYLLSQGAYVIGIDTIDFEISKFYNIENYNNFKFIKGNFNEKNREIENEFTKKSDKKKIVFHMAGIADAKICRLNPAEALKINVLLVFEVLHFCKKNKIKKIIFPSTGLVYGNRIKTKAKENDVLYPADYYAYTKMLAEKIIIDFSEHNKIQAVIIRVSNVYGAESYKRTVLGKILKQVIKKNIKKIKVFDLSPVRDFIYINDVIEGFIRLSTSKINKKKIIVNLSSGEGVSIRDVIKTACEVFSVPFGKIVIEQTQKSQYSKLILDNNLVYKITKWKPGYSLKDGLMQIFDKGE